MVTDPRTSREWADAAADRVMARCDDLARITSDPGGTTRFYLTDEHRAANALVAAWMAESDLSSRQDAAGNLRGRSPQHAGRPALFLGSHLDTVARAGRYDGMLGVLMALEVAADLAADASAPPLEVIAFWDEEGGRFSKAMLGSSAVAGVWDDAWLNLTDAQGVSLAAALMDFGLDPARVTQAALPPDECLGYLEAHIEQRPLLDNAGIPLGVVSSIAAQRRYNVRVIGEPRHVGTPYSMRHDALAGAGEAVVAIEQLGAADPTLAAVVGDLRVRGGAFNIVPGRVDFTLDVRTSDSEGQDRFERALTEALAHACVARGLKWEREVPHASPEAKCSPRMRRAISRGCAQAGVQAPLTLFSPAGHDAMGMARITDMGMLFLRNENGTSHAPEESVTRDDVAIGLVAFREAIRSLGGGR